MEVNKEEQTIYEAILALVDVSLFEDKIEPHDLFEVKLHKGLPQINRFRVFFGERDLIGN